EQGVPHCWPLSASDQGLEGELSFHGETPAALLHEPDERGRVHLGGRGEREQRTAGARLDTLDAEGPGGAADPHDVEELLDLGWRWTEAIHQLGTKLGDGFVAAGAGQTLVKGQSLVDLGNIVFR